jgi:hypothetical protein
MHCDVKHGHESVVFGEDVLRFGGRRHDFVLHATTKLAIVADATYTSVLPTWQAK